MPMEVTNNMPTKYTIWTSDNVGEFVKADLVISLLDTVSFYQNGREVRSYDKQEFIRYNPSFQILENTE